jgi:double zinc ribbon protein/RING finger family protein
LRRGLSPYWLLLPFVIMAIEFVRNFDDLSTDKGYQFKFYCDKCGNGYMSSFEPSMLGMASSAAQVAGNLLGGIFGRAASSSYEIQRAVGGQAHDKALATAVAEMKPKFKQCTRCGRWVCGEICWNHERNLCEECAPNLDEEIASAQAEAAKQQAFEKAQSVDWLKGRDIARQQAATCPSCGAHSQGGKFCPECGAPLSAAVTCSKCGTKIEGHPRFCPECGEKLA